MARRVLMVVAMLGMAAGVLAAEPGFRTLVRGGTSGAAGEVVIRTPQEWSRFWLEHCRVLNPRPRRPQINFHQEMVVAVFEREITAVRADDGALLVLYRKLALPDDILEASREPHVIAVKKSRLPVRFIEQSPG